MVRWIIPKNYTLKMLISNCDDSIDVRYLLYFNIDDEFDDENDKLMMN